MPETFSFIATAVSVLTLIILVAEKIFGGGNALANKFHTHARETTAEISALRAEMDQKIDEYERVSTVGFEAVRSNIHAMQLGLLEFRAKIAEELHLYIRKDDYNAGLGEVKRDMQNGFHGMEDRLGQLQDLIMYANPDAARHLNQPPKRG